MHVFRWDLDKTYLETDFHSVRSLIRTALEPAARKRNVPGSSALLRALTRHNRDSRVHVLSGSPTQMRAVLEEKLALDGIRFDSLTLKDNLGNLRRGRLRAVTSQLGYKLPRLLQQRVGLGPIVKETLFGDDAEVDAVIYGVYADAVAGRLEPADVSRIMEVGGAYLDAIDEALEALRQVGRGEIVERIYIRVERGVPLDDIGRLGAGIVPVFSWFQAAVLLYFDGRLDADDVGLVARACIEEGDLGEAALAALVQDLVRRGLATPEQVAELARSTAMLAPFAKAFARSLAWLGPARAAPPPTRPSAEDYVAFLRRHG